MLGKAQQGFVSRLNSIGMMLGLVLGMMVMPAAQAAEGLYSMKALIDSPVYADGHSKSIGAVDNVIVDNHMKITGIIINVDDSALNENGKKLFVQTGLFHLKTEQDSHLDSVHYRVDLDKSMAAITDFPVVDDTWWDSAKQAATEVWQKTKSTAKSAWDATKGASQNVFDSIREKIQ